MLGSSNSLNVCHSFGSAARWIATSKSPANNPVFSIAATSPTRTRGSVHRPRINASNAPCPRKYEHQTTAVMSIGTTNQNSHGDVRAVAFLIRCDLPF